MGYCVLFIEGLPIIFKGSFYIFEVDVFDVEKVPLM